MEHKKGNGNEDFFHHDDDFDAMLEEKQKRWQQDQSITDILDNQKIVPQISDKKVELKGKEPVEDVAETSKESTSSTEIPEAEALVQSTPASDVEGQQDKPGIDSTDPKTVGPLTVDEAKELLSDPAYSQSIISGKTQQLKVRGMKTGPFANQYVAEDTVSEDAILDRIGQHRLADHWRLMISNARKVFAEDPTRLMDHIERMRDTAFLRDRAMSAYKQVLDELLESGNEVERKRVQEKYSSIFGDRKERSKADKDKAPKAPPKPKKAKALSAQVKQGIDTLVSLKMFTYEQAVERYKTMLKLDEATLAYLKKCYGIADDEAEAS